MAYMNQEKKKLIAAELKRVVPSAWKYSLSINNSSTIELNIKSAPIDLLEPIREHNKTRPETYRADVITHCQVGQYYLCKNVFSAELLEIFGAIGTALNLGNWDRSEIQTDYFDVGHYISINIGRWNMPFVVQGGGEMSLTNRYQVVQGHQQASGFEAERVVQEFWKRADAVKWCKAANANLSDDGRLIYTVEKFRWR